MVSIWIISRFIPEISSNRHRYIAHQFFFLVRIDTNVYWSECNVYLVDLPIKNNTLENNNVLYEAFPVAVFTALK